MQIELRKERLRIKIKHICKHKKVKKLTEYSENRFQKGANEKYEKHERNINGRCKTHQMSRTDLRKERRGRRKTADVCTDF